MLNTIIVVAVTNFSGTTTPDKNGEMAVMLQCIAGTMPNRNVLSGTVAKNSGFEVGKTYLVNVREAGYDKVFGTDYQFVKVAELESGTDIVKACREIGEPKILVVDKPEGFEKNYQRKGDAVEGERTRRIREGLYEPALSTFSANARGQLHETAAEVKEGTSVGSGGKVNEEFERALKANEPDDLPDTLK